MPRDDVGLRRVGVRGLVCAAVVAAGGMARCAEAPVVIKGGPGPDVIDVGAKAAWVLAGPGADVVRGSPHADLLDGNTGNDRLLGEGGADTLHGGRGNDTLDGGEGADVLSGDRGDDVLTGGWGADRFVLAAGGGHDVVTDFAPAEGDRIQLDTALQPTITEVGRDAEIRLSDGSQMRLLGVPREGLERWILRPAAPTPQATPTPAMPWPDREQVLRLICAVAASAGLGLLWRWWVRRRGRPKPAEVPPQAWPAAADASFGSEPPHHEHALALGDRLPHAQSRSLGLDLMRATAVLLVLVSHWMNNIVRWLGLEPPQKVFFTGILGVEMFFALSGFLIGQILITQAAADPSWRNYGTFLVRRWLRTLPLYYLVLAILLVAFPAANPAPYDVLKFATLTQNLWGPMPPGLFFAVSWSLTVEEWFYVLFGAAVFLAFRIVRADWAIWPAILLFIVPPVLLRLNGSDTHVVLAMLDQIVYGVAMAALYRRRSRIFRHPFVCLFAGISLIAAVWTDHMPGPQSTAPAFVWNMIILGCALLLPAALRLRTLPAWLSGAVVTASAQSYGLYLMHLTILVDVAQWLWNRHLAPTWVCAAIAIIAPFVLSYLSFRYLESPILRLRPEHRRRQAAAPAALRPAA